MLETTIKIKVKTLLILLVITLGLISFAVNRTISTISAEQSGSSPESGADSRLKQLNDSLVALDYGDPDNGAIGDWGDYWNRISSAAHAPFNDALANVLHNGGNVDYPQSKGGVEDLNAPPDTYQATWTACIVGNNYCGTGEATSEKKDENTGLVWSTLVNTRSWFTANNCQQPSNGIAPLGPNPCSAHGNIGCTCTKLTGASKTGCEAQGDGNWRLPYQKELMMAYIDGAGGSLTSTGSLLWSSTTNSVNTVNSWYILFSNASIATTTKTQNLAYRCVR